MADGVVMRMIVAPASLVLVIFGDQFVILLRAVRWECMRKLIGKLIIGGQVGGISFHISQQDDIHLLPVYTGVVGRRSEEHTSELQSRGHLVCRLLHDKNK